MLKPHECWAMVWSVRFLNGNQAQQQPVLLTSEKGIHDAITQLENHGTQVAPEVVGIEIHKIEKMAPALMLDDGELGLVH